MIKNKVKENIFGKMDIIIKAPLKIKSNMDLVHFSMMTKF